jgi:hypothetical protein
VSMISLKTNKLELTIWGYMNVCSVNFHLVKLLDGIS